MVFARIGCSHVQNVMYFPHRECVRILCNLFSIPLLVYAYISGILVVVMSQGMCTQHMHFLPAQRYASTGTSYGPVSVCLCLSVTTWCSVKGNEWISMVFGMEASFDQSFTMFYGYSSIYLIRVLPSGTFSILRT